MLRVRQIISHVPRSAGCVVVSIQTGEILFDFQEYLTNPAVNYETFRKVGAHMVEDINPVVYPNDEPCIEILVNECVKAI